MSWSSLADWRHLKQLLWVLSILRLYGSLLVLPSMIMKVLLLIWRAIRWVRASVYITRVVLIVICLIVVLQPQMVVVTVNGLFKEHGLSINEDEMLLAFVRTFVLVQSETKQGLRGLSVCYKISNEQMLIYRPSVLQIKNAFPTLDRASVKSVSSQVSLFISILFTIFLKLVHIGNHHQRRKRSGNYHVPKIDHSCPHVVYQVKCV